MSNHSRPASKKLTPAFVACLVLATGLSVSVAAAAEPVVHGYGLDLEAFFDATVEDCPDCSEQELSELGQGLHFLLSHFRQETVNPSADVCVAEAAMSREMAVLTYDLVRAGTITPLRWRDFLRARAQISGGLSEITKEEMLAAFLRRVGDRTGTEVSPDAVTGQALKIYGAAQLSRIFEQIKIGEWDQETWARALSSTEGGFHRVVDALLATTPEDRAFLDAALLDSRPQHAWIEGELPHLASLPPDFQVGDVPARRDAILAAYDEAVRTQQWAAFYFFDGTCGVEAQFGWREKAIDLSESFPWMPTPDKRITIWVVCGTGIFGLPLFCPVPIDDEIIVWGFTPIGPTDRPGTPDPVDPPGPVAPGCSQADNVIRGKILETYMGVFSAECGASVMARAFARECSLSPQIIAEFSECQLWLDDVRNQPPPPSPPPPPPQPDPQGEVCQVMCFVARRIGFDGVEVGFEVGGSVGAGGEVEAGGSVAGTCDCRRP